MPKPQQPAAVEVPEEVLGCAMAATRGWMNSPSDTARVLARWILSLPQQPARPDAVAELRALRVWCSSLRNEPTVLLAWDHLDIEIGRRIDEAREAKPPDPTACMRCGFVFDDPDLDSSCVADVCPACGEVDPEVVAALTAAGEEPVAKTCPTCGTLDAYEEPEPAAEDEVEAWRDKISGRINVIGWTPGADAVAQQCVDKAVAMLRARDERIALLEKDNASKDRDMLAAEDERDCLQVLLDQEKKGD